MTDFVQQLVKLVERDFSPTLSNDQQARLDEQRALIDEQRGLIDEQRACLVQHQREIEKLQTLILGITATMAKQLRETPDRETANKKRKMNDDLFDIVPEESDLLDTLFNDI